MEKWKATIASHFSSSPDAAKPIVRTLRYTDNSGGTKLRAGQVKYREYLEEYETFPLHFLHQKASIE